jgi:hypothetical protein
MCDEKYALSKETLQWMKQISHSYQDEICSHLINQNNILYINNESISTGGKRTDSQGKVRQSCNYSKNFIKEYIFHSHPFLSGSYPSKEDTMKVFKHPETKVSIIATRWGLYTIKNTELASSHYKHIKHTSKYDDLFEYVRHKLQDIGRIDASGMELTADQVNIIKSSLEKISRKTAMDINFCKWSEV